MHLIISHAAGAGAQCQAAIPQLALPNLDKLLRLLHTTHTWHGAPENLTPLPERVQASSMGLCGQDDQVGRDGLIPWAAAEARERGLTAVHGDVGWAWITPCHWRAHAQHVEMLDPAELDLRSDESEALRTSMASYFAEDGIVLHPCTDGRWLALGTIFHDLPTASLQRVANASINPWLPRQPQAKGLRRLQSEMQMLLYTHPVNDAREARGAASVNAFWVSGTGALPAALPGAVSTPTAVDSLRRGALRDDAPSWTASWQTLDQTLLADALAHALAGAPLQITLCGENRAVTLAMQGKTWWQRLHQRLRAAPIPALLQSL